MNLEETGSVGPGKTPEQLVKKLQAEGLTHYTQMGYMQLNPQALQRMDAMTLQ